MNVIRNATAADIQRHAQIVLLEPGRVFHYAADFPFDKVKIPAKVSLELLMYKKNVPVWVLMEADFPSLMQGKWTEESEVDLKVEPRITQEIAVSQAVARVNPKM